MLSLVRPDIAALTPGLHQRFQEAKPFRHLVIDDFLEPGFAHSLVEGFPTFDESLSLNESGQVGHKCVHQAVRSLGASYEQVDALVRSPEFLGLIEQLTGIPDLIYDPDYFGGGTHENLSGQDLDLHIDFNYHPTTHLHRRLNLILFLNESWETNWGGALELSENPHKPEQCKQSILPVFNRLVMFATTENSWHGFPRIADADPPISRKSFALYYYSRERPAEELGRPHSTVYVERPLPAELLEDAAIAPETREEIERLLARRDQHIDRLYQDVEQLMSELDSYQRSRILRLTRRVLQIVGKGLKRLGLR